MKIIEPPFGFTPWHRWADRQAAKGIGSPGVYLLARFEAEPPVHVDACAAEIFYIGQTCDQTLRDRLRYFGYSAFEAKRGHGGGRLYGAAFGDQGERLFVSMFPVLPEQFQLPEAMDEASREVACSAFIQYVERRLLWEYVQRRGVLPQFNLQ